MTSSTTKRRSQRRRVFCTPMLRCGGIPGAPGCAWYSPRETRTVPIGRSQESVWWPSSSVCGRGSETVRRAWMAPTGSSGCVDCGSTGSRIGPPGTGSGSGAGIRPRRLGVGPRIGHRIGRHVDRLGLVVGGFVVERRPARLVVVAEVVAVVHGRIVVHGRLVVQRLAAGGRLVG